MTEKFIADEMLGKLTKYLRMFNIDVLYFSKISDEEIIEKSRVENRIIITRDTRLIKRKYFKNNKYVFIEENLIFEQLKSFNRYFKLWNQKKFDSEQNSEKSDSCKSNLHLFSRCLCCNEILMAVEKEMIKDNVPEYVYKTEENFKICNKCNKIYWKATHYQNMLKRLKLLF